MFLKNFPFVPAAQAVLVIAPPCTLKGIQVWMVNYVDILPHSETGWGKTEPYEI